MIDFSQYPLSPETAKAARNYLGLNQDAAAKASELPINKLKRFESGKYLPDPEFLQSLREFYQGEGYEFPNTPSPGASAKAKGNVFPNGVVAPSETDGFPTGKLSSTTVQHIRISPDLTDNEIGYTFDLIEANEDRVTLLLQEPLQQGLLGGYSDNCEARHGQAVRLLAENGTLFAKLLGRPLSKALTPDQKPETHADLLGKTQADMHGAVGGAHDAVIQHKEKHTARPETLRSAILG